MTKAITHTQKNAVRAANWRLYAALQSRDLETIEAALSVREPVTWERGGLVPVVGRRRIVRAFDNALDGYDEFDVIRAEKVTVVLTGNRAFLICIECWGAERWAASNLFVLEDDDWRLTHHQATMVRTLQFD